MVQKTMTPGASIEPLNPVGPGLGACPARTTMVMAVIVSVMAVIWGGFSSRADPIKPQESLKSETLGSMHWAFRPVSDPEEPRVMDAGWPRTSIDRFVLSRLEGRGESWAKEADRRTLLRRVTFDLTGLPPTPEEAENFEADDRPEAYEQVVERLLASPRYGERWGRHWLDVVRYADTAGDTADYPVPDAWRYRNYVIEAFNTDKPYDQFLREQIAGDILARRGSKERYAEQVAATGFLALSRRFGFDSENYQHLTIQDTLDTLGQSVLGMTLGCARCHNHKYDPVTLSDYYALYGIFDSTRYAFPGSEQKMRSRSLVPLRSPEESGSAWRDLERQYAELGVKPGAILRSLDEADGDFEMQHVASGGSYGVLVPPWFSEGAVSVTEQAQSPFRNVYPFGKVGASIPPGTNAYRIHQSLTQGRTGSIAHVNLDFRVATNGAASVAEGHRFRVLTRGGERVLELELASGMATLRVSGASEALALPEPGRWNSFQARIDPDQGVVTAFLAVPGRVASFREQRLLSAAGARVARVEIVGAAAGTLVRPGLEVDHVAIRGEPLPPVATELAADPNRGAQRVALLKRELESLEGVDGGAPGERVVALRRAVAEATAEVDRLKRELDERLASGPVELAYGVTEGTPHDVRIQLRGEPEKPGDLVRRGFPKALGGEPLPENVEGSGRLELAEWLTRAAHPLTARVMVNRIWQYHFGQGLVKTPNDFGLRGEPPSEPALLDHLASRFVQSGWSMKAMHRLIVRSATYRQSDRGRDDEKVSTRDGMPGTGSEHDEFVGFQRRRLSAEELRDAILFVSGDLDFEAGRSHPFPSPTTWGFSQHGPFAAVYEHRKRSIYLMTQRLKRHPFLALFDGADPNASTADRRATTVPTQALFFLNDPFVHARSESLSQRVRDAARGREERVRWAYRQVLGRLPVEAELADGVEFLTAYLGEAPGVTAEAREAAAYAGLARVLFGSNEFLGVD